MLKGHMQHLFVLVLVEERLVLINDLAIALFRCAAPSSIDIDGDGRSNTMHLTLQRDRITAIICGCQL